MKSSELSPQGTLPGHSLAESSVIRFFEIFQKIGQTSAHEAPHLTFYTFKFVNRVSSQITLQSEFGFWQRQNRMFEQTG
jgi:hypothetical protein